MKQHTRTAKRQAKQAVREADGAREALQAANTAFEASKSAGRPSYANLTAFVNACNPAIGALIKTSRDDDFTIAETQQ